VTQLTFGMGQNSYLANSAGDIFLTDLPATASSGQLGQIGVFGANQGYAISFSGDALAAQGVIPMGQGIISGASIYTIPGGTAVTVCATVLCRP
jgi:hypothetical protein